MAKDLYVGNLSPETTTADLKAVFGRFGAVLSAHVVTYPETGRSRGFGFVEMADGAEAAVLALNGAPLRGRALAVQETRPREATPRPVQA